MAAPFRRSNAILAVKLQVRIDKLLEEQKIKNAVQMSKKGELITCLSSMLCVRKYLDMQSFHGFNRQRLIIVKQCP